MIAKESLTSKAPRGPDARRSGKQPKTASRLDGVADTTESRLFPPKSETLFLRLGEAMTPACSLLLVDDDDEFLEIVNRRFTRRGATTVAVDNPAAAIEAARTAKFHVAIVDRTLPGQDGVRLTETLKAQQPEIRVIMLSGHSDEQSVAEARRAGVFEYLVKPCALADLETAVARACEATPKAPA